MSDLICEHGFCDECGGFLDLVGYRLCSVCHKKKWYKYCDETAALNMRYFERLFEEEIKQPAPWYRSIF